MRIFNRMTEILKAISLSWPSPNLCFGECTGSVLRLLATGRLLQWARWPSTSEAQLSLCLFYQKNDQKVAAEKSHDHSLFLRSPKFSSWYDWQLENFWLRRIVRALFLPMKHCAVWMPEILSTKKLTTTPFFKLPNFRIGDLKFFWIFVANIWVDFHKWCIIFQIIISCWM